MGSYKIVASSRSPACLNPTFVSLYLKILLLCYTLCWGRENQRNPSSGLGCTCTQKTKGTYNTPISICVIFFCIGVHSNLSSFFHNFSFLFLLPTTTFSLSIYPYFHLLFFPCASTLVSLTFRFLFILKESLNSPLISMQI